MASIFERIKAMVGSGGADLPDDYDEGYLELDTSGSEEKPAKIMIRPFILQDFADTKPILDIVREGYTIALVNIKPLKDQDLIELKRSINKLKKTVEALEGDIAGFGDDWICIAPSFAKIHREKKKSPAEMAAQQAGDEI
ncbi:hypothetical protein COV19_00860 [Candidatus Woesearchaeota archaeon CG10_big_fil_rev_8_21_14_0_10_44_13]|nr:MAG: hypothetical protein COV19_00860 [Candidatus Woesearchaeota archaeon CG10_big_fil_rev_8_21_14_0_10_44_13]